MVRHLWNLRTDLPINILPTWRHTQLFQYHRLHSLCVLYIPVTVLELPMCTSYSLRLCHPSLQSNAKSSLTVIPKSGLFSALKSACHGIFNWRRWSSHLHSVAPHAADSVVLCTVSRRTPCSRLTSFVLNVRSAESRGISYSSPWREKKRVCFWVRWGYI